ncbi:MAG: hypothetical protein PCFJNLEI_00266 [Verrucomicrobiae bacterium]|nr:hypothetical protein [Verrucomicrobiae bacterium]
MKRVALILLFAATLSRAAAPEITVTPGVNFATVSGNDDKFRADFGRDDGWMGGIGEATWHQDLGNETTFDFAARGAFQLQLDLTKKEVGYLRAGFSQFRKYSDTTGGFYQPFTTPSFQLAGDPHLDIGNITVEVGLTLPKLPLITLGYERQYRTGQKSLLEWGGVTEAGVTRKIYPSVKNVDEQADIFKIGVAYEIKNIQLDNQFRYERYETDTKRVTLEEGKSVTVRETYQHDAFFNAFRLDSRLNEQVYWSVGYLYTTLSGDGGMSVNTALPVTAFDRNWVARVLDLGTESHVLNANLMFGPFKGLTLYTGVQAEQTDADGLTDALLTTGLSPTTTNQLQSTTDKTSLTETFGARYTKIPHTTLYAEARLTQQQIDLDEVQTGTAADNFVSQTDTEIFRQDYRAGFNTAPWRIVTFSGRYRYALYQNDYDASIDTAAGYPAYITMQDFTTDEVMLKLTVRPCTYFSASLQYQLVATDIQTGTAGVPALAPKGTRISGEYNANIYSVSATLTPISRLYLMGLVSYQDTCTKAFDNQAAAVTAYNGDVYTVLGTAGFVIDDKTDATLECSYSFSDNFKNNAAAGLPLGLDNQRTSLIAGLSRKFTDKVSARLRYGWYQYNETSNGGLNDYTSQLVSAACTVRF